MDKTVMIFFIKTFFPLLGLGLFILSCSSGGLSQAQDKKQGHWGRVTSFQELTNPCSNSYSEAYQIRTRQGNGDVLVMALHAGMIERGTGELLESLVQVNGGFSFYKFEGFLAPDYNPQILQSGHMHLTSHRFDDPKLLEMAREHQNCLSLHGFPSQDLDICVGGGVSNRRKQGFMKHLKHNFPGLRVCVDCCPPYRGAHKDNPVNQCQSKGLQLEFGIEVRRKLLDDQKLREDLAEVIASFFKA